MKLDHSRMAVACKRDETLPLPGASLTMAKVRRNSCSICAMLHDRYFASTSYARYVLRYGIPDSTTIVVLYWGDTDVGLPWTRLLKDVKSSS